VIAVGLELGAHVIKIAVVEGGRGSARVRDFEVLKIDAKKGETEDDIVSVVDEAFKRLKAPRNEVVASVRAQDCMIREILVPFSDEEKIRKTVKYQAENYFTSVSIDDLIIEYSKFAEVEAKSKLMVAGIKKAHIARRLGFLEECSIDPTAIDLDVAALYNTYAELGTFEDMGAALIVEVEADTLKVGVVEEGKLRLARAIRMRVGSMKLDKARAGGGGGRSGESGIYDTAADESARLPVVILDEGDDEAFSLEDSGISDTEREGIIHRIFMEIDRTVASVNLNHEVEQICLTGASCALDGIEELFSEHFEIPAARIDIASQLGGAPDKKEKGRTSLSLEGATAIGLALKGLGVDHAGMDFRQEEFGYSGTFQQLKRGLACTLTLLFALVFLYAFGLKQELREKTERVMALKAMQRNLYTVLLPSLDDPSVDHQPLEYGRPEDEAYLQSLQRVQVRLKNKYSGNLASGPKVSALEVLRVFGEAKAECRDDWKIEVMKARIDPAQRSTFDCNSAAPGAEVELKKAFEEVDLVDAEARSGQEGRDGEWAFQMVVQLAEEEGS